MTTADRTADDLTSHWRGRARFVVLDAAFGAGDAFLAARRVWRSDPDRCDVFHYLGVRPPHDAVHDELAACWPPATDNLHRLVFEGGAVQLLVGFGDFGHVVRRIEGAVDAFLLDGLPVDAMAQVKAIARLAAPGAIAVARTADPSLDDALRRAGFTVHRDGAALRAVFAPRFTPRMPARRAAAPVDPREPVVIVGAGLAGCATAGALAEFGRSSIVLERRSEPASEGSGNAVGLFHGVVHRGDGHHARFHRAAALAAHSAVAAAMAGGQAGSVDGLLRIETGASLAEMQRTIEDLDLPPNYVRAVDAHESSRLAGTTVASAAWFFRQGGWVDPRGLCRSYLASAGARAELRTNSVEAALCRDGDHWRLDGPDGAPVVRSAHVVLACAGAAIDLLGRPGWPLERSRGQVSSWPASEWRPDALPRLPVTGAGYVAPPVSGRVWFGASSRRVDHDEADDTLCDADQRFNRDRLAALLAEAPRRPDGPLGGRVGFRWSADDRLPVIGAVPGNSSRWQQDGVRLDQPRFVPRAPGLYVFTALGSRGIATSALGGAVIAAAITGGPSPLERDLLDAVDPARFVSRAVRRGLQPPVGFMAAGSIGG